MHLPTGAMHALTIILFVGACETMLPTEGASPPADLLENNTNDGGSSGGSSSGGGGMGAGNGGGGGY
jgi:hypothetical protein